HNAALQADLDHASIYQQRLGENITEKEKHGDNETLRSTRSQILEQLNRTTNKVFGMSFRDWSKLIPPGDSQETVKAIHNSRWIIFVLTPDWVRDEWPKFVATLTSPDNTNGSRIIPVLLKPCSLHPTLLGRTYADMTGSEKSSSELKRIVVAVGRQPKPGNG